MTNPTPTVARSRRAFLRSAISSTAGAAIGAVASLPAMAATTGDDRQLIALIAEEERLYAIGEAYDSQLRDFLRANPKFYERLDDLPEPQASLLRKSIGQFSAIKPKTVEGAAALLRWTNADSDIVGNVIAALPDIVARRGGAA